MTTAHRPTWTPAVGSAADYGNWSSGGVVSQQKQARDAPGHLSLKYRDVSDASEPVAVRGPTDAPAQPRGSDLPGGRAAARARLDAAEAAESRERDAVAIRAARGRRLLSAPGDATREADKVAAAAKPLLLRDAELTTAAELRERGCEARRERETGARASARLREPPLSSPPLPRQGTTTRTTPTTTTARATAGAAAATRARTSTATTTTTTTTRRRRRRCGASSRRSRRSARPSGCAARPRRPRRPRASRPRPPRPRTRCSTRCAPSAAAVARARARGRPRVSRARSAPRARAPMWFAQGSGAIKRKWNDDVVFRNQARDVSERDSKRFINDTIRNDFHKRFLSKYVQ